MSIRVYTYESCAEFAQLFFVKVEKEIFKYTE